MRVLLLLLLGGCIHHYNLEAYNAVQAYQQAGTLPACGCFYEGQQLPDGSVVDQVDGHTVVVIIPNPQSAEGEEDHLIPCSR